MPGVEVALSHNSGWQSQITDTNGCAVIHISELDLQQITINGVQVARDPWARVQDGLEVVVLIKDTNAIPRELPKWR